MRGSQSSFANSSASERPDSGIASRAQKIPRNHSRSSINFDACNSPDFNSVVLEKELSALDLEDQVNKVCQIIPLDAIIFPEDMCKNKQE